MATNIETINDFILLFSKVWLNEETGNNNEYRDLGQLYSLWEIVGSAGKDGYIQLAEKRKKLLACLRSNWENGLSGHFHGVHLKLEFKKAQAESIKKRYERWTTDRAAVPNLDSVVELTILICMLCLDAESTIRISGLPMSSKFAAAELLSTLAKKMGIKSKRDLDLVKTKAEYLVPFVFASLMHLRFKTRAKGEDTRDPYDNWARSTKDWLPRRINDLNESAHALQLTRFKQLYFETLWSECKNLDLRDLTDQYIFNFGISDLFVLPTFQQHEQGIKLNTPLPDQLPAKIIIKGETGTGKSSLFQAMAVSSIYDYLADLDSKVIKGDQAEARVFADFSKTLLQGRKFFPIFIRAKLIRTKVQNPDLRLFDLAIGHRLEEFGPLLDEFLEDRKTRKQLLLLIDGLDEIIPKDKTLFDDLVRQFMESYPEATLIFTSRPVSLNRFPAITVDSGTLRLNDLDQTEKEIFIKKWTRLNVGGNVQFQAEEIIEAFQANRYLSELAKNPYMLNHILYLWASERNTTEKVKKIISTIIDKLIIKRWIEEELTELSAIANLMRNILADLALDMLRANLNSIPELELVGQLEEVVERRRTRTGEDWRPRMDRAAREISSSAGLLLLKEQGFAFQLPVFQYFLAAEAIGSRLNEWFNNEPHVPDKYGQKREIMAVLPDLARQEGQEVITMLFSLMEESGGRNWVSPLLVEILIEKSALTVSREIEEGIDQIFQDLIGRIFGDNYVAKIMEGESSPAKEQIDKCIGALQYYQNHFNAIKGGISSVGK